MKKATPRNNARPPIHANIFTPMNCSQLMAGAVFPSGRAASGFAATGWKGGGVETDSSTGRSGGADSVSGGGLIGAGVGGISRTGIRGGCTGEPARCFWIISSRVGRWQAVVGAGAGSDAGEAACPVLSR